MPRAALPPASSNRLEPLVPGGAFPTFLPPDRGGQDRHPIRSIPTTGRTRTRGTMSRQRTADGYNAGYAEQLYEKDLRDRGIVPRGFLGLGGLGGNYHHNQPQSQYDAKIALSLHQLLSFHLHRQRSMWERTTVPVGGSIEPKQPAPPECPGAESAIGSSCFLLDR